MIPKVKCGPAGLPISGICMNSCTTYFWFSFLCHGFNHFRSSNKFSVVLKKAYQMVTKEYHMVKKHTRWSCGMPLHDTYQII